MVESRNSGAGVAIVREVSDSYPYCSLTYRLREPINLELARTQHRSYIEALEELDLRVVALPADPRFPDGCFVEDVAVLLGGTAVITWMGATARNGEQEAVANCLAQWTELVYMMPPAQLEGGDVLKIGKRLFVGESARTNRQGVEFLRAVAEPRGYSVVNMPVRGALHLKSAMTCIEQSTVIAAPEMAEEAKHYMRDFSIIELPHSCADAANVLSLRGRVLMSKGFPTVARELAKRGFAAEELGISEFTKGEGGLTCLSIIVD